MFKKLFNIGQTQRDILPITLKLRFEQVSQTHSAINIDWAQDGAPADIMFDIGFLGFPSGVLTRFLWDTDAKKLENVFVIQGDSAFFMKEGWAYSGNSLDGSGKIEHVWTLIDPLTEKLNFKDDQSVTLKFIYDPSLKKVQD